MKSRETSGQEPYANIMQMADARGIVLSESRYQRLTFMAEGLIYARKMHGNEPRYTSRFHDAKTGVVITQARTVDPTIKRSISLVSFVPTIDNRKMTYAHPEYATRLGHQMIQGIQNYVLLADSNYLLDTPDELRGQTNAPMARCAERLGFVADTEYQLTSRGLIHVRAPYDTLQERAFAPDVLRLDETLQQRLAIDAGRIALTS